MCAFACSALSRMLVWKTFPALFHSICQHTYLTCHFARTFFLCCSTLVNILFCCIFHTHTHMHIHASKRIERVLHTHTHIICIENPLAWKCNRDLVASNIWSNKNYNNNSKATGMWIAFAFSMRQKSVFHFRCSVHVFVWPAKRAKGVRRSDEGEWRAHSFIWHSTA